MKKWLVIVVVCLVILIVGYKVRHDLYYSEDFCPKVLKQLGKNGLERIPASEFEKKNWPSAIGDDGKIYLGVHEQLKCEMKHKAAFLY